MMKIHRFLLIFVVILLNACTKESSRDTLLHAVRIEFSEEMARNGKAQSILSLIHGTLSEDGTISGLSLTLSVATRAVEVICLSQYRSSGISIDQMVIEIGESTVAVNDEQMDYVELRKRIQQYKKAADLASSIPVLTVQFRPTATINDMIDGLVALAESGIRHVTLH
jgi:hypothetical protein